MWAKLASLFGGNWDESGNAGSRASNWNNEPWNSNNNIAARGVCDRFTSVEMVKAAQAIIIKWSAAPTCFGEYTKRFTVEE